MCVLGGGPVARLTAEQMDEQRVQNIAYQYLCRLEEAKRSVDPLQSSSLLNWFQSALYEHIPSAVVTLTSLFLLFLGGWRRVWG